MTSIRALFSKPANILLLIIILLISVTFHYYDYIKTLQFSSKSIKKAREVDKLLDLNNFRFIINPRKMCNGCDDNFLMIIAVISSVENRLERNEVRLMWGKASKCIKVVFITGDSFDEAINAQVVGENRRNSDMIQGSFVELTDISSNETKAPNPYTLYKHMMVLQWASHYCANARFIVKIDEDFILYLLDNDVIIDLAKFRLFLKRVLMEKDGIACRVLRNGTFTWKGNTTATTTETVDNRLPYCWGGLVVYPSTVVLRLLEESHKLPPSNTDDVFITGILARRAGIRHHNFEPHFFLKNRDKDWMEHLKALFALKISVEDFFDNVY